MFGVEGFNALLNLLVAVGNPLLVVAVGGQRLFQCEDMFGTVVADEAFGYGLDG